MSGLLSNGEGIVNAKAGKNENCTGELTLSDAEGIVDAKTFKFEGDILNILNAQAGKLGVIDESYIGKVVTASVGEYEGKLLKLLEILEDGTCILESGDEKIIELNINKLTSLKVYGESKGVNMESPLDDNKTIKSRNDNVVPIRGHKTIKSDSDNVESRDSGDEKISM